MDEVEFWLRDLKSRFDGIDKSQYYLSYSGGKDSHFLYWFIVYFLLDEEIEIVGINTFMEHQEIRERIYANSDRILIPKVKPMEIKKQYGIPCFSKTQDGYIEKYQNGEVTEAVARRFFAKEPSWFNVSKKARDYVLSKDAHRISNKCCYFLKKQVAREYEKETGKKPILGVRQSESLQRNAQYTTCLTQTGTFVPIHDFTDEMMDKIYAKYGEEIGTPKIYEQVERTGCMGCPYGSYKGDTKKELQLVTPQQRKFLFKYFGESYEVLGIRKEDYE